MAGWRPVHGNRIHCIVEAKGRELLSHGFLGLGIWSKNRARLRLCPATPGGGTPGCYRRRR
ncbi:MAG: hypothetical protein ACI80N_004150, partial [Gammaproteobacteria bacterium]